MMFCGELPADARGALDAYHIYTVDTHSLFCVEELEKLWLGEYRDSKPVYTKVAEEIEKRELLVLAVLFHDIGKGEGKDHSNRGADLIPTIARRLNLNREDSQRLEFLVRPHLDMAHISQRRDLHDERLINDFARTMGMSENLRMLFLLTYADIKGVGPDVWTEWKGSLLQELYEKTYDILERGDFYMDLRSERVRNRRRKVMEALGTRIEEAVEFAKSEVNNKIREAGEAAAYDVGIAGLDPKLIHILGRLPYRTSYGQNALLHSLEVAHLSGALAAELGGDVSLAKKSGLLHDIGKAVDHEVQGTHVEIGIKILEKFHLGKDIINTMKSHHEDYPFESLESMVVSAADAISASRPGARKDTLENYLKRLEELESVADSFPEVEKSYAIQAGREIRIFVKPERIDDLGGRTTANSGRFPSRL